MISLNPPTASNFIAFPSAAGAGASAQNAIRIGLSRLTAIQLELEEQLRMIRTTPDFYLQRETYDKIQRYNDVVHQRIPPPREPSHRDTSDTLRSSEDTTTSSLRRLVEIELSLKKEVQNMMQLRHLHLTPQTLDHVRQAMEKIEKMQSMTPKRRSQASIDLCGVRHIMNAATVVACVGSTASYS